MWHVAGASKATSRSVGSGGGGCGFNDCHRFVVRSTWCVVEAGPCARPISSWCVVRGDETGLWHVARGLWRSYQQQRNLGCSHSMDPGSPSVNSLGRPGKREKQEVGGGMWEVGI